MAISIAEYLGTRTDSATPLVPCEVPPTSGSSTPVCPFNALPCSKIAKGSRKNRENEEDSQERAKESKHPVCAVRRNDGKYYIVCEDRLISSSTAKITDYQKNRLMEVARVLFHPDIEPAQVGFKSEVSIQTGPASQNRHRADFVFAVVDETAKTLGPRRMLVEVQGGGETNNTGSITRHIQKWAKDKAGNSFLQRQGIHAGTIVTNAWRRFQEQLFVKATTATKTGWGFAVVVGEVLYDYIESTIPDISTIRVPKESNDWNVVFVVYKEKPLALSIVPSNGPVELEIDPEKTTYTKLDRLFSVLQSRGQNSPQAFDGTYKTLDGKTILL